MENIKDADLNTIVGGTDEYQRQTRTMESGWVERTSSLPAE